MCSRKSRRERKSFAKSGTVFTDLTKISQTLDPSLTFSNRPKPMGPTMTRDMIYISLQELGYNLLALIFHPCEDFMSMSSHIMSRSSTDDFCTYKIIKNAAHLIGSFEVASQEMAKWLPGAGSIAAVHLHPYIQICESVSKSHDMEWGVGAGGICVCFGGGARSSGERGATD